MRSVVYLMAIIIGITSNAFAQKDAEALKLLDAMSSKYKKFETFSADFMYTMENEEENINESYSGKVIIKGQKYRLSVAGQQIFNDGATMWTYLPTESEVSVTDAEEGDMSPSEIYTAYQKGYSYNLVEFKADNAIINLIPEKKDSQFESVVLEIDKNDFSLKRWTLKDSNGSSYAYIINNFKSNVGVDDTYFVFDSKKHPGVEVLDYR